LYGCASPLISRQTLHAYRLSFVHPITNEPMRFVADLPEDIKKIIKSWESSGTFEIIRTPKTTAKGTPATFMTEGRNQSVLIRSKG